MSNKISTITSTTTIARMIRIISAFLKLRLTKSEYATLVDYLKEDMYNWKLPAQIDLDDYCDAEERLLTIARKQLTTSSIVKRFAKYYNVYFDKYIDDYNHPLLSKKFKQLEKITNIAYKLFFAYNKLRHDLYEALGEELFLVVTNHAMIWSTTNSIPLSCDWSYLYPNDIKEFTKKFEGMVKRHAELMNSGSIVNDKYVIKYHDQLTKALELLRQYTK